MSARQRQRLQQLKLAEAQQQLRNAEGDEEDESEESEEEDTAPHRIFSFAGMESSSDEDEDDNNSDNGDDNSSERKIGNNKPALVSAAAALSKEQEEKDSQVAKAKAKAEEEEAALLEHLIQESAIQQQSPQNLRKNYLAELFASSAKSLDIDALMSRRFGAAAAFAAQVERDGGGGGGGGRAKAAGVGMAARQARKWMFGRKEEWGSPEPFARGGLGMVRQQAASSDIAGIAGKTSGNTNSSTSTRSSANRGKYTLERSSAAARNERIYQAVAATGDVNRLVMYLVHVDAFHCGALLQLCSLFCKLPGSMERAMDLVRRALHSYEVAALEGFWRDVLAGDAAAGCSDAASATASEYMHCLLDWRIPENTSLFIALFRYTQISAMMGYNALAADTARMTLCLSPTEDPMNVLLALDCYLVRSSRANAAAASEARALIRAFMGIQSATVARNLTTDKEWVQLAFAGEDQSLEIAREGASEDYGVWQRVTVAYLPSWWFSWALVEAECEAKARAGEAAPVKAVLPGQGRATGSTISSIANTASVESAPAGSAQPLSVLVMAEAVRRFPQLLQSLLSRLESSPAVLEMEARLKMCKQEVQHWLTVAPVNTNGKGKAAKKGKGGEQPSPWFDVDCACYDDPPVFGGASGRAMDHLCSVFIERNADLYTDSARLTLLQQAVKLATHVHPSAGPVFLAKHTNYLNFSPMYLSSHPALDKYKSALLEDFGEKFTFIPEDANPLDPGLMDPVLLEAQQRDLQRQRARREEGVDLATILGVQIFDDEDIRRQQLEQATGIDFSMFLGPQAMVMNEGERDDGLDIETFLMRWIHFNNEHGHESSATVAGVNVNHVQRANILDSVRAVETAQYALDPNAPLMQLFLQSMFPWFQPP